MIIAAQYYRPPFPDRKRWASDMAAMRDAGLRAVYLWACWGWIEPEPGRFVFDDYDELIQLAGDAGLGVIINVIAEIQPFWIHRHVPDSRMIDHLGRPVISVPRRECNVGLTPGGCTDNPQVRALMERFIAQLAQRYASRDHLVAWDLWNETRWAVHADGHVCHCPHTLSAFRAWLAERHGDLDGLNRAWQRRYTDWADVQPGKLPGHTYTEMLEFQAFLTERSSRHMAFRHEVVRAADQRHLIVAHAANPAPYSGAYELEQAVSRGNDWDYTDLLDGFGASLFPAWFGWSNADLGARIESARSGAQDKLYWVGEVQGGTARGGIEVQSSVHGAQQQRWVWSTIARGAKAISFWCWRDEVFGRESSGFGITGHDGHAQDRLAHLRRTARLLDTSEEMLNRYSPDPARVAVVFDPTLYQLDWSQYGQDSAQAQSSVIGTLQALERLQLPYDVLEARHRARLPAYKLVIMPWPLIVDPGLAADLLTWVHAGGTLVAESELDAYDRLGFYRYPDERPFANALGIASAGRRPLSSPTVRYEAEGRGGDLASYGWLEPLHDHSGAEEFVTERSYGRGRVIAIGTFPSIAYFRERSQGFEHLLGDLATATGAVPGLRCSVTDGEVVQWRTGRAGDLRALFVLNAGEPATVAFSGPLLADVTEARELAGDQRIPVSPDGTIATAVPGDGYAILTWTQSERRRR
jgi:beta-galactosidase